MNKTFSIDFVGPAAVIDASIDAFATHHGYTDASGMTKLEYARMIFRRFAMQSIEQYYADQAAIAAAAAAKSQAGGAIDMVAMTVGLT